MNTHMRYLPDICRNDGKEEYHENNLSQAS